jgi:hypothetical protein
VSVLVVVPVVVGCAVVGSVIGITHPLQSILPAAQRSGELSDQRLASAKLVEAPSEAALQPPGSYTALPSGPPHVGTGPEGAARAPASAPSSVLAVSTRSVDRPLSPGASLDVAATQGDRPELVQTEGAPRATGQSHRQARAKRLRRMLGRPARPKPAGTQVDAFISSILPIKSNRR